LDEPAGEMYGKIMAWSDGLIGSGLELLTDTSLTEIKEILAAIEKGKLNPRDAKAKMAKEIVSLCFGKKETEDAEKEFNKVFRENELPSSISEVKINEKELPVLELLLKTGLVFSKGEARRLIEQKGVKIDEEVQEDWQKKIAIKKGQVIQVGKRKFARIA